MILTKIVEAFIQFGIWLFLKIVPKEPADRYERMNSMTPCRNCNKGQKEDIEYVYEETGDGTVWLPEWKTCDCCGGDYENCENCAREFPSSVEAEEFYKAVEKAAEEEHKKDYGWD